MIEIDARELDPDLGRYAKVWSRCQWKKEVAAVRTMYKRKGQKINPVDVPLPGGVNQGGTVNSGGQLQEGETWNQIGKDLEWKLARTRKFNRTKVTILYLVLAPI